MVALSTLYKIGAMAALGVGAVVIAQRLKMNNLSAAKATELAETTVAKTNALRNFEKYMKETQILEFINMNEKSIGYYAKDTRRILMDYASALTPGETQTVGLANDFFEKLLLAKQMDDWPLIQALREQYTKTRAEFNPKSKMEDYQAPNPEEFLPFNMGWDDTMELGLPGVGSAAKRLKDNNIIVNIDEKLPVAPIKDWVEKGKTAWGIFDTEAKK
jgi:hypothetical protein